MDELAALAAQQRAERARLEAEAAARLVTAYGRAWAAIERDLTLLTDALAAAQAQGIAITPAQLRGLAGPTMPVRALKGEGYPEAVARVQARHRALLDQIAAQIDGLAAQAGPLIRAQQAAAIAAAATHAEALARAALGPPPPGVAVAWDRVPVEALRELVGALADGRPLGALLGRFGADARAGAEEALTTALIRGAPPRVAARALEAAVEGLGRNRALRLARSAMLDAYRDSTLAQYRRNDLIVAYRRLAAYGPRTCLACLALSGKIYPLGEEFGRHANCRCVLVPVPRSWADLGYPGYPEPAPPETGADWFARQPEETRRRLLPAGAWEPYQRGAIALGDFAREGVDPVWGASVARRPLRDVLAGAAAGAAG